MADYGTVRFEPPPVDLDGDGQAEQFVFELSHGLRLEHMTRTDYIVDGGSNLIAIIDQLYNTLTGEDAPDNLRQTAKIDLGAGEHVVDVEAEVAKGSPNQWGTGDGDPVTDATGEHPVKQIQLLDRVLQKVKIDSSNTATVSIGEYDDDNGAFPSITVAPEQPSGVFDSEQESSTATVSITFIDIFALEQPIDAWNRTAE